ncbi:MAG: beta-lactamase family protein [Firmicutes bacterium]|nr:beta-lactamase family protein [Candidatus Fermentithermobacillaceae bacterium]
MIEDFKVSEFEDYVCKLMEKTRAPGVAVGISVDGSMEYFKGFGLSDVEKNQPITEDTVFGLASLTKSFTALCINLLAEEKKLSVSHPVKRYLPEFSIRGSDAAHKMTIHSFLTHTSGMPPLPSLDYVNELSITVEEYLADRMALRNKPENSMQGKPVIRTNKDLLRFISNYDFEPLGRPGQYMSYSNDCFSLLGEVVERVSGVSFEQYLKKNVLEPLGMDHTFIDVAALSNFEFQGLYYRNEKGGLVKAPWKHRETFVSSGSLKSSIRDLLNYTNLYIKRGFCGSNRICETATADRITSPYYSLENGSYYGYGFQVEPEYYDGVTLVHHGGNIVGVASYIGFIPEKKISVSVLTNLSGFPASKVFFAALNGVLGLPRDYHEPKLPAADIPSEHIAKFAGLYASGEGTEISVAFDGKNLFYISHGRNGANAYPAKPTGYNSIRVDKDIDMEDDEDSTDLYFLFDTKGNVWAMRHGLRLIRKTQ